MKQPPKKHSRRRPIEGLTPADVIRQMQEDARGPKVRKVRSKNQESEGPVLPGSRPAGSGESGAGGVSSAPPRNDAERPDGDQPEAVLDAPRDSQLSKVLKRMMLDVPRGLEEYIRGMVGQTPTNAEALGAVIWKAALDGKQWAVEMIRDQTEGKPVRAAQINNTGSEVESLLDRVSANRLNDLAKGRK